MKYCHGEHNVLSLFLLQSWTRIHDSISTPSARAFAATVRITTTIYLLFGATGVVGTSAGKSICMNDVWSFYTPTEIWTNQPPQSAYVPTARHSTACCASGGRIICFGGLDSTGQVLSDLPVFNINTKSWILARSNNTGPGARFGHAAFTTVASDIYVFAGKSSVETFEDVWKLEILASSSTAIQCTWATVHISAPRPRGRSLFGSSILMNSGSQNFVVSGGVDSIGQDLTDTWYLRIAEPDTSTRRQARSLTTFSWSQAPTLVPPAPPAPDLTFTSSSLTSFGNYIVSFGGMMHDTSHSPNFLYGRNMNANASSNLPQAAPMPDSQAAAGLFAIGNDMFSLVGVNRQAGSATRGFYKNSVWKYRARRACAPGQNAADSACYPCTLGTYPQLSGTAYYCSLCSQGTYAASVGATSCSFCPAGYYSLTQGGDSKSSCIPCQAGFYALYTGQAVCLPCNLTAHSCPPATVSPLPQRSFAESRTSQISPPSRYVQSDTTTTVDKLANEIMLLGCLSSLTIVVILLAFPCCLKGLLTDLDLFSDRHMHPQGPVWMRHTLIGGVSTVLYFLLVTTMFAALLLTFLFDNEQETNALVNDLAFWSTRFHGNFTITVTLLDYRGECMGNSSAAFKECTTYLWTTYSNIETRNTNSTQCRTATSTINPKGIDCQIRYSCSDCDIRKLHTGSLNFSFYDYFAAASGITLDVKVNSGILKPKPTFSTETAEASSETQIVGFQTTNIVEATTLIRGSAAWEFEVGAISSVFNVSTDGEFNTGYIMELESVREGAITIPENYHFDPGVTVAVTLPLLRLVYVSVVRRNQSILQLISSMLGSLAGLLLLSLFCMYIFESGKSWRMRLKRYLRRRTGFNARYVPKLRTAFLNMLPEGRDETEVCGHLWAHLAKDFYWRISDKHLHRQLHERCSSVSLDDVREAICEFDQDNDSLIDYMEFCELLQLLGLLPHRRLTDSEANTYWRGRHSENTELKFDAGSNMNIGTGVFSDLPDIESHKAERVFIENLEKNADGRASMQSKAPRLDNLVANTDECHDWVTDLVSSTARLGIRPADEASTSSNMLADGAATRASQSLLQGKPKATI